MGCGLLWGLPTFEGLVIQSPGIACPRTIPYYGYIHPTKFVIGVYHLKAPFQIIKPSACGFWHFRTPLVTMSKFAWESGIPGIMAIEWGNQDQPSHFKVVSPKYSGKVTKRLKPKLDPLPSAPRLAKRSPHESALLLVPSWQCAENLRVSERGNGNLNWPVDSCWF